MNSVWELSFMLPTSSFILRMGGCSSVGRASAFQAEGREFESRRPLQFFGHWDLRPRSSGVERLLGKEEVMSSNLIAGSSDFKSPQL
jgi:hypothetical protein